MAEEPQDLERITLAAGRELQGVDQEPDAQTQDERLALERARSRAEVDGLKQDIEERKRYAGRIFKLICCWVGVLFLLLLCQGFGGWMKFSLPQPVLLAVIGSTTLNVLGLFYIVANYLFPDRKVKGKTS